MALKVLVPTNLTLRSVGTKKCWHPGVLILSNGQAPEALEQICVADLVIINKTDLLGYPK